MLYTDQPGPFDKARTNIAQNVWGKTENKAKPFSGFSTVLQLVLISDSDIKPLANYHENIKSAHSEYNLMIE